MTEVKEKLSDRMLRYENEYKDFLPAKTPIIIRLDGKNFSKFTKGLDKPFDKIFTEAMEATALYLCENLQNCKIAYSQSDEISILLIDYENEKSQQLYGGSINKIVSITSSMATLAFNKGFRAAVEKRKETIEEYYEGDLLPEVLNSIDEKYSPKFDMAIFDSRTFALEPEEVVNYFISRQDNGITNSISALAQKNLGHSLIQNKNSEVLKYLLRENCNINWNDLPLIYQRGFIVSRENFLIGDGVERHKWAVNREIPLFKENKNIINKYVMLK